MERRALLEYEWHKVISIWECDWYDLLKRAPRLRRIHDQLFIPPPMHPRKHALCGGRVEPFVLWHLATQDELIEYFDIVSLLIKYM
jgi:hypothetical protein